MHKNLLKSCTDIFENEREALKVTIGAYEETDASFQRVARILADASNDGLDHPLWQEWNAIRQVLSIQFLLIRLLIRVHRSGGRP